MPAGDQKQKVGKRNIVRQPGRQRVAGEMVDSEKRPAEPRGNSICTHHAGKNAAYQARTCRDGDRVDVRGVDARLVQCGLDCDVQFLGMRARGDFGHDSAKGRVQGGLIRND